MAFIDLPTISKATAEWQSSTTILQNGQIGIEITTTNYNRYKRGDGSSAWSALPYIDTIPPGGESPSPGSTPEPSDTNPLMDGTASAGTSDDYSRGDHRHPSDAGKADADHSHPSDSAKQDKLTAGNGIGLSGATISAHINAATASTTTAGLGNGADVNLQTFTEYDPNNIFTNARYSASYGYGIKVAKAGKYLLMASGNVATSSATATAVTLALRKVTSGGTSSYLMRSQMVHASTSAYTVSIAPFVATLAANDYLSLYLSNAKTTVNGLNLTAIFLG